jgi:glycosyltransferase involved in cell wall biosynthesis
MRILQVASGMPVWAGTEKHIMDLSPGLLERGHDVVIGCRADSEIEKRARAADIPTMRLEMHRDTDWRQVPVFTRAMWRRFDVVHIHHYLDYLVPAAAARLARVPAVVMTRHLPHPFKSRATAFVCSRILYDRIIAVSEFIGRVLIESGVAADRIAVVNNGIDPTPWRRPVENHIRSELNVPADAFLVGAAGRLFSGKGFDRLVRAIGLVRLRGLPVQCAIAGSGDEMQNLTNLITELGLTDAIHLLGFRDDVPALFAAADAVAVPSTWAEPFGYVVVEAMAAGRPVIGSNVGGMVDIITPEVGFLPNAGDVDGIADAIEDLMIHPEKKQAMGRSGRARANQFSLSAMVSNVEKVFDGLLGGPRPDTLAESRA